MKQIILCTIQHLPNECRLGSDIKKKPNLTHFNHESGPSYCMGLTRLELKWADPAHLTILPN